jgi:pyridinium-3,5-bisthiocarboxylic acid mononucleotide nickel chelatase
VTGARDPSAPLTAWFNCYFGIAGDMALGSLVDAGADIDEVVGIVRRVPVGGWTLEVKPESRAGLAATRALVRTEDDAVVRTHAHIVGMIEEARLPPRVRQRALDTFDILARAEGKLHRRPAANVHFHEVGAHDAIVDVVGTCAALEVLGVSEVTASAVATGTGMVRSLHGLLPNPAPAVLEILRGVPMVGRDLSVELTTPTGAAILAATATGFGPMPPMTVDSTGYGAGARDLEGAPNCTQVVLGHRQDAQPSVSQDVVLLETNLDDATGETLSHTLSALLEAGAYDAWVTPAVMKKGRPGHVVSVLGDPVLTATLVDVLRSETGTLGVRGQTLSRWPSTRTTEEVQVEGLPVRVKVSPGRVKAEHRDAARVARLRGLPLREVVSRAEEAWRDLSAPPPDDAS